MFLSFSAIQAAIFILSDDSYFIFSYFLLEKEELNNDHFTIYIIKLSDYHLFLFDFIIS